MFLPALHDARRFGERPLASLGALISVAGDVMEVLAVAESRRFSPHELTRLPCIAAGIGSATYDVQAQSELSEVGTSTIVVGGHGQLGLHTARRTIERMPSMLDSGHPPPRLGEQYGADSRL